MSVDAKLPVLVCQDCQREYPLNEPVWRCGCGGLLDIRFTPVFDLSAIQSRKPTLWRYREAIALPDHAQVISFEEGFTPLLPVKVEGKTVWIKQDHLFPTGSYKDRGASALISAARSLGIHRIVEDSSGNAGAAIAAYCARAGIASEIYVPASTSAGKLAQIERYGAILHRVPGTREDTSRAVAAAAETTYYASHSWNPFFFQGTKTFAFEVCEQLGWRAPDTLVVPVGNGTLLLGAALGFRELYEAGITQKIPRIAAVQAGACAPLADAFHAGLDVIRSEGWGQTAAEGIAIAAPVRAKDILREVRDSQGVFIRVDEAEIMGSLDWACGQGFYIEPTSAATVAGLRKYAVQAAGGETIVSVFTGHGLKTTDKMLKH